MEEAIDRCMYLLQPLQLSHLDTLHRTAVSLLDAVGLTLNKSFFSNSCHDNDEVILFHTFWIITLQRFMWFISKHRNILIFKNIDCYFSAWHQWQMSEVFFAAGSSPTKVQTHTSSLSHAGAVNCWILHFTEDCRSLLSLSDLTVLDCSWDSDGEGKWERAREAVAQNCSLFLLCLPHLSSSNSIEATQKQGENRNICKRCAYL